MFNITKINEYDTYNTGFLKKGFRNSLPITLSIINYDNEVIESDIVQLLHYPNVNVQGQCIYFLKFFVISIKGCSFPKGYNMI